MEQIMDKLNITIPLEAQFVLRKVEIETEDMSKEDLRSYVWNLVFQRILERQAITQILKDENICISFDSPTDEDIAEMMELTEQVEDGEDPFQFLS
jgi:hypothetical protein